MGNVNLENAVKAAKELRQEYQAEAYQIGYYLSSGITKKEDNFAIEVIASKTDL